MAKAKIVESPRKFAVKLTLSEDEARVLFWAINRSQVDTHRASIGVSAAEGKQIVGAIENAIGEAFDYADLLLSKQDF